MEISWKKGPISGTMDVFMTRSLNSDKVDSVTNNLSVAFDDISRKKRLTRIEVRKKLKLMDPYLRAKEDAEIQNIVLQAPWFQSAGKICAYLSCNALREVDTSKLLSAILPSSETDRSKLSGKRLYLPRVENKNCYMRMLNISSLKDVAENSMGIMEPTPVDLNGDAREDAMEAGDPVELFLIPGLAFDRSGRRLGRGGGYYDNYLQKYQELVRRKNWRQPLLVALCYSLQIMEEGVIPVAPHDVSVDALVSPSGVIPVGPTAMERMKCENC